MVEAQSQLVVAWREFLPTGIRGSQKPIPMRLPSPSKETDALCVDE
jgi:hypothetical protein